jgi:hypothetical protein
MARAAPHEAQNFRPSLFADWQCAQNTDAGPYRLANRLEPTLAQAPRVYEGYKHRLAIIYYKPPTVAEVSTFLHQSCR